MYAIRFDPGERILHLRLEGFWTAGTLACFAAEMLVRSVALGSGRRPYGVLSDSSDFPIQSGVVAAGLARITARGAEFNAGPTAIVVGTMLNKLQVERTMPAGRVRVFLDAGKARAWLARAMAAPETAPETALETAH